MSDDSERRRVGYPGPADLSARVAELWAEFRDTMLARVAAMEEVSRRLETGNLEEEARRSAFMQAHKLAGSLGTFGLIEASRDAQTVEKLLGRTGPLGEAAVADIADAIRRIRRAVERGPEGPQGGAAPPASGR